MNVHGGLQACQALSQPRLLAPSAKPIVPPQPKPRLLLRTPSTVSSDKPVIPPQTKPRLQLHTSTASSDKPANLPCPNQASTY